MKLIFTEDSETRARLFPLSYTRTIANLRLGILTIDEKWIKHLGANGHGYATAGYLQGKFEAIPPEKDTIWIVNGTLPGPDIVEAIGTLKSGEALAKDGKIFTACGMDDPLGDHRYKVKEFAGEFLSIERTWDIFRQNGRAIHDDYGLITSGRESRQITDKHTIVYGSRIFLEEGAEVKAAILNAENGPIYIGKGAQVHEGAIIKGPFAMGEQSVVNMGAKLRGDTSCGPHCKIGGEISNSVLWGYSNKAHDGFLGHAVIGQWCNLGAGFNNSNLKNTYDSVRMWDYRENRFVHTGLQFCGLIMGDHSKSAINTMFNTGTTVGVAANIFGEGFPQNAIPSFSWGGAKGMVTHHPRKALHTADIMMKRRDLNLTGADKDILNHIFEESSQYRVWEKKD